MSYGLKFLDTLKNTSTQCAFVHDGTSYAVSWMGDELVVETTLPGVNRSTRVAVCAGAAQVEHLNVFVTAVDGKLAALVWDWDNEHQLMAIWHDLDPAWVLNEMSCEIAAIKQAQLKSKLRAAMLPWLLRFRCT